VTALVPFDRDPMIGETDGDAGLADRPDPRPYEARLAAAERICLMYAAAKRDQADAPSAFLPAGEWVAYHEQFAAFHRRLLERDLPAVEAALRDFWRNDHGAIVKEYATFAQVRDRVEPRCGRFHRMVRRNWLVWRDVIGADPSALDVPPIGNPWGVVIDGRLVAPKAARYHALGVQIGGLVADRCAPTVVEIGAGYGGLAAFLLRDEPGLRWIDLDLPETLVYAAWHLLGAHADARVFLYGEGSMPDALEPGRFDAVLLPNHVIGALPDRAADVLVNTFSLSEVGPAALAAYLGEAARLTGGYFLHHNMNRAGVVNRGHERIPASSFDVDKSVLKLIARNFDLFHGQAGDYREYLYERRSDAS